jgi:hypothetical protein
MPTIKCWKCGGEWIHDAFVTSSIEACPNCRTPHKITEITLGNWRVEPAFPSLDELLPVWELLTNLEKSRLIEASRRFGVEAYTMCESACFDALVSILRRIYGGREELGHYMKKMEQDPDLKEEAGFISSFKAIRNKVDHPVQVSSKVDAESTFSTTKRLILIIAKKKLMQNKK